MADVTMAHPDYRAAPPAVRYDGRIGPDLWETLEERARASICWDAARCGIATAVLPDGLQLHLYRERDTQLTVSIDVPDAVTDEAREAYIAAVMSILPVGDWQRGDVTSELGFRRTILQFAGPAPEEAA